MIILFAFILAIQNVIGLNILVYSPTFANSHMIFLGQLADTLTDAGHKVTLLVPVSDQSRRNASNVQSTKDIVFVDHDEEMQKIMKPTDSNMETVWKADATPESMLAVQAWFKVLMENTCINFLRNPTIFDEMKNKKFDVAILEPLSVCGMGFINKLGIDKFVLTSSCTFFEFLLQYIGEIEDTSSVPSFYSTHGEQMTLHQRYENYRWSSFLRSTIEEMFDAEEAVYKKYLGNEVTSWRDLLPTASLYFTNSNPYVDFPRPVIQKTVPIGGISVNLDKIRAEKLSEEWNSVLNLREKTLLISFGSMAKSKEMPIEWRDNILKVIQAFPEVTFIWKYESEDLEWAGKTTNIHFDKWVPQRALLADSRVTAFLTHAGLGSINELAHCGKPSLLVPLFGDQKRNANMLARHDGSILFDKFELDNFDKLKQAVKSILYEDIYRKNAERLAELIENQPNKPKDQVIKNVEFVAKYGPFPKMDPYIRHLNYFQKTHLDIFLVYYILPTLPIVFVVSFIVFKCLL
ncbi:unnamed protein product [Caenorhabditis angaria]|uniref:glucuronosyltransferase n=1 Tax=Caenorhabditis angaria TaxID=860376 RepID=A0A9P1I906_9PELO|nr:unnamed protein product [Caenorhabditis angaria]